jgi:pimeloyl-ACP methyl ester carboxylesterase
VLLGQPLPQPAHHAGSPRLSDAAARHADEPTVTVAPDRGHLIQEERPDLVAAIVD